MIKKNKTTLLVTIFAVLFVGSFLVWNHYAQGLKDKVEVELALWKDDPNCQFTYSSVETSGFPLNLGVTIKNIRYEEKTENRGFLKFSLKGNVTFQQGLFSPQIDIIHEGRAIAQFTQAETPFNDNPGSCTIKLENLTASAELDLPVRKRRKLKNFYKNPVDFLSHIHQATLSTGRCSAYCTLPDRAIKVEVDRTQVSSTHKTEKKHSEWNLLLTSKGLAYQAMTPLPEELSELIDYLETHARICKKTDTELELTFRGDKKQLRAFSPQTIMSKELSLPLGTELSCRLHWQGQALDKGTFQSKLHVSDKKRLQGQWLLQGLRDSQMIERQLRAGLEELVSHLRKISPEDNSHQGLKHALSKPELFHAVLDAIRWDSIDYGTQGTFCLRQDDKETIHFNTDLGYYRVQGDDWNALLSGKLHWQWREFVQMDGQIGNASQTTWQLSLATSPHRKLVQHGMNCLNGPIIDLMEHLFQDRSRAEAYRVHPEMLASFMQFFEEIGNWEQESDEPLRITLSQGPDGSIRIGELPIEEAISIGQQIVMESSH